MSVRLDVERWPSDQALTLMHPIEPLYPGVQIEQTRAWASTVCGRTGSVRLPEGPLFGLVFVVLVCSWVGSARGELWYS